MIDIVSESAKLKWYHKIEIVPGVFTIPERDFSTCWDLIESNFPTDLAGLSVLDVGTRDGKYAFMAEKQGAIVRAIDSNRSEGAELIARHTASRINFEWMSLYDLDDRKWDVILFFGVLYHLRYPMKALSILSERLNQNGLMYLETAVLDSLHDMPLLYCPVRSSPYEITSCSFFNLLGLEETLWSFGMTMGAPKYNPKETGNIKRCFLTAQKTHAMRPELHGYWNRVHDEQGWATGTAFVK